MRNHDYDAFLEKSYFWRENGRGRHRGAKGSGTSILDQKLAHWVDLLGQPLSRKLVFKTFGPEPPSLNKVIFYHWKDQLTLYSCRIHYFQGIKNIKSEMISSFVLILPPPPFSPILSKTKPYFLSNSAEIS